MQQPENIRILFIAGFGSIFRDRTQSSALDGKVLGKPWGQSVSRFLSPEGRLIGIAFTPFFRDKP